MNSSTSPVSFQRITEQSCGEIFLVLHCLGSRDTQYQGKNDLVFLHLLPVGCPVRAVVGRESWS